MAGGRSIQNSPEDLAIKLGTKDAIRAAGGQEFVAGEVSKSQSRLCDYGLQNTCDFIPANDIRKVEAMSAGAPGWPHITRVLARAQGFVLVPVPQGAEDPDGLTRCVMTLAAELGDVSRGVSEALSSSGDGAQDVTPAEAKRILVEVAQMEDMLAAMRVTLQRLAGADRQVR
ncbi:hypothetical protein BH10PSE12_BH10PSE12_03000 [soil metagenome]